ncbi:hypothetical protein WJX72_000608 [[Myrmecia] bisecta]|uniref:Proteasome maturation protein n=1 Tax=[Myrmecia] bisecta TaxID=41462 RepID=A0AAW1P1L3_9CHLO
MEHQAALPMLSTPHDTFRQGLSTLKDETTVAHPVQSIQQNAAREQEQLRMQMMRNVYGSALPARLTIEKQILGRVQRLPGIPSSQLGLESLTGALDDFAFESYLSDPASSEMAPPDLHSQMEARLKMGTPTTTRSFT